MQGKERIDVIVKTDSKEPKVMGRKKTKTNFCTYIESGEVIRFYLQWIAVLSSVFLLYDAIAVYVTPLFTKSGKSIMEEAVIGSHDSLHNSSSFSNAKNVSFFNVLLPLF